MSESVERERKLGLDVSAAAPHVKPPYAAGPARVVTLAADYVDTVDRLLIGAGYSLRRRVGGSDEGWHLKLPRQGDARRELHAPLAAGADAGHVPRALRAEVADLLGRGVLLPVAQLVTVRSEVRVSHDRRAVAVVCDDHVVATTTGGQRDSWREVEIELLDDGTADDLDALEAMLRAGGAVDPGHGSKVARVASQPDSLPGGARGRVLAHVMRQVGVLQAIEGDVRRDVPDSVHQARVAVRRLRSTLRTFGAVLVGRDDARRLRDEARWLMQMLGGPRDAEILRAHVADDLEQLTGDGVDDRGAGASMLARLDADHRAAHEVLVDALDSERAHRLTGDLVQLVVGELAADGREGRAGDDGDDGDDDERTSDELASWATRAERRVERALGRASAADGAEQVRLMHEVRKRAKEARYAHEAIGSTGDAERWEAVTEALGSYQDTVVVVARVRELAEDAAAAGGDVLVHDTVIAIERARGVKALADAVEALERARRGP